MSAPGRLQGEGQFTRTVLKALDVLECLAGAGQPLTAQEVAHGCGLSRTTAHRLLTTLLTRGYVASPREGHYRLGASLLRLSHRLLAELELPALAKPELREICRRCNETAYLAVLDGGEEAGPGVSAELQRRAGRILGVADGDAVGEDGHLDAVAVVRGVPALEPSCVAQIRGVHAALLSYSSATALMIFADSCLLSAAAVMWLNASRHRWRSSVFSM